MRVVLDTNVLIDSNNDELSFANKIVSEVASGKLEAYANHKTFQEYRLILNREITNEGNRELLKNFLQNIKKAMPVYLDVVETDDEDNKILAAAVASKADYLITSDYDLLRLEEYQNTKIVKPSDFWIIYEEEELDQGAWKKFLNDFIN